MKLSKMSTDPAPMAPKAHAPLHFPYMFWAHHEMGTPSWSLAQSGMPSPAPELLGPEELEPAEATSANLAHPSMDAIPRLESQIAARYGVSPDRVMLTMGASSAMHLLAASFLTAGTRVAVDLPSYQPFRALPPYFGAHLVEVLRREHNSWRLAPEDVEAALDASGTTDPAHIFFTNPSNPTGALSDLADLQALGKIASDRGGILICNESYMDLTPPAEQVRCAVHVPNSITIGSFTKPYGLGALRVGWIVLGEGLADERTRLLDNIYLNYVDPPTAALRIALRASEKLDALLGPFETFAASSRPLLFNWITNTPGVSALCAKRGLVVFARIANWDAEGELLPGDTNTEELSAFLAMNFDLAVTPGEFFGQPGCLRLGFGSPKEHIQEGLSRLTSGLAAWRTR